MPRSPCRVSSRPSPKRNLDSPPGAVAPSPATSECPGSSRVRGDGTRPRLELSPAERFFQALRSGATQFPNVHGPQRTPARDSSADLCQVLLRPNSVSSLPPEQSEPGESRSRWFPEVAAHSSSGQWVGGSALEPGPPPGHRQFSHCFSAGHACTPFLELSVERSWRSA
jgi:hypothetical protein